MLSVLLATALLYGCKVEPQPIQFGIDQCVYCKMTIVDEVHCAQVVTNKGRASSFDAIECMVDFLSDKSEADFSYLLVADFANPGEMIDAKNALYLISKQIPSPMGAFLSAFPDAEALQSLPENIDGRQLTWKALKDER